MDSNRISVNLINKMRKQYNTKSLISKFSVLSVITICMTLTSLSANAQVIQLESEDTVGAGLRLSYSYNQHMPGGQGMSLEYGFDFAELTVANGVSIIPALELQTAYNIDIDDPSVKHLVKVGGTAQVRISLDMTKPGWVTKVNAIPWFGVTANGCWTRDFTRENNLFVLIDSGWQLCYGPALGIDLGIGDNMVFAFGLETLFFALGSSGYEFSPFMMVGSRIGLGYKFQF